MARVQNPIIGRARGTLGNAVLTKQYGNNTVRSKAIQVKDANSDEQKEVRGKMSLVGAFVRQALVFLKSYLAKSLADMPTSSWFVKSLMLSSTFNALTGIFTFDASKLFGGASCFFGKFSEIDGTGNIISVEIETSSIFPIVPANTSKFNYVIFDNKLEISDTGTGTFSVASNIATASITPTAMVDTYKDKFLYITIQNDIDKNDNLPSKAYKVNTSSRLSNFGMLLQIPELS